MDQESKIENEISATNEETNRSQNKIKMISTKSLHSIQYESNEDGQRLSGGDEDGGNIQFNIEPNIDVFDVRSLRELMVNCVNQCQNHQKRRARANEPIT